MSFDKTLQSFMGVYNFKIIHIALAGLGGCIRVSRVDKDK